MTIMPVDSRSFVKSDREYTKEEIIEELKKKGFHYEGIEEK
jgi:hypothetical protein